MHKTDKYTICLLDEDGYELDTRFSDTLKEAGEVASYLLSEAFARACESTHKDMRTLKALVYLSSDFRRNRNRAAVLRDYLHFDRILDEVLLAEPEDWKTDLGS